MELFAFVEVDDRRNSKTCHVVVCSGAKGVALTMCDAMTAAYAEAAAETKRRAGAVLVCLIVHCSVELVALLFFLCPPFFLSSSPFL